MADNRNKTDSSGTSNNDMPALVQQLATLVQEVNKGRKTTRNKEPEFYRGDRDAVKIDSWISAVENYAFFEGLNDEQTGIMAVGLLKDKADTWYRTMEKPNDDEPPLGWLALKRLLKDFFCPENSELLARDQIAMLRQTGDINVYINNFLDLKLAIKDMTDVEACDKFMRGLRDGDTIAYVRQYYDGTLKSAIRAALTYDGAHHHVKTQQQMFQSFPTPQPFQQQAMYHSGPTPMELDWIDRRNGGNHGNNYRNNGGRNQNYRGNFNQRGDNSSGNTTSGCCFFCGKPGHIKRKCRERMNEIKKMDENRRRKIGDHSLNLVEQYAQNSSSSSDNNSDNKELIDFDTCYSSDSLNNKYPLLQPEIAQTSQVISVPSADELTPIIYHTSTLNEEFNHLEELNSLATTLPLYSGSISKKNVQILIDSGASENYVSPGALKPEQELIPVYDRKVETAGGQIAEIKHKVQLQLCLNGYTTTVMAYVFPTKFDLILGRAWLKQEKPEPNWSNDSWCLNNGSIKLIPIKHNNIKHSSLTPPISDLSYLISHKQADRYLKKGADGFLLCIQELNVTEGADGTKEIRDTYWDDLVGKFSDVFKDELPGLPPDRGIHHIINTGNAKPISRPPFKMSPLELDELKKQINELLRLKLIKPSHSPWGAPVLFVRKKPDPGSNEPGKLRMCVDYRCLNKVTVKDTTSLPRIDECLERFAGAKYFSSIDLKSGYHQLRIDPKDVDKTAFNTRYGKYAFLVLPFGLSNAPPTFQKLMNNVLSDCLDKFALVYLDDILIWSNTLEEHKKHVEHVLKLLKKNKLIVNLKKCEFGKQELTFVGYKISASGISPSPEKIKVLQQWPKLTNVQEVRQFVGFAQFYKRFIKDFASIAAPLTDLTRGTGNKKRPILWTDACQKSFDTLKTKLATSPVLKVVDMSKPFKIEVDASDRGCGAVLLQPSNDPSLPWHPICFESKKFSEAETRYPAQERELLGIIYALRKWRCYVDGCPAGYTVYSDHMPLQYFRTKENPPSRLVRWMNEIEAMDPHIVYKKGTDNHVADVLSRMNYAADDVAPDTDTIEPKMLYATWDSLPDSVREDWPLLLLPDTRPKVKSKVINDVLNKEQNNFIILSNRLYRQVKLSEEDTITNVPYLPFAERADTLAKYHNSLGHAGVKTTLHYMLPRFWWPGIRQDIIDWLKLCPSCQVNRRKGKSHKDVMHPLKVPSAFDRWHLDFMDLPTTTKGNRWLLIGVDYATNWIVARAMPVASAEAVADFLYEEIMLNFGCMSEVVTDRGSNFNSLLMKAYSKRVGYHHKLTSAYHARTNSKVERINQNMKGMLRKYVNGAIHRRDDFVHAALWACRIRVHSTTGFSPYYLTYGRQPRIPGDIMRPFIDANTFKDPRTVADITSRELTHLNQHRAAAEFRMKAMAEKDKERWDAAIKPLHFEIGDRVLLTHEGRYGLEPNYKGPYVVVQHFPDYGTYKLETLAGEPLKSLVHVDRLAPAHGPQPSALWYDPTAARREWRYDINSNTTNSVETVTDVLEKDFVDPLEPTDTVPVEPIYDTDPVAAVNESHISKEVESSPSDVLSSHPSPTTFSVSDASLKSVPSPLVPEISPLHNNTTEKWDEDEEISGPSETPNCDSEMKEDVGFQDSDSVQGRTQSQGGAIVKLDNKEVHEQPLQEQSGTDIDQFGPMELELPPRNNKRRFKPKIPKTRPKKKTKLLVLYNLHQG